MTAILKEENLISDFAKSMTKRLKEEEFVWQLAEAGYGRIKQALNFDTESVHHTVDDLPIAISYGEKTWTVRSALREFLSNMLDCKTNHKADYMNGFAVIQDFGEGLAQKSFVFGESTRDDSQIGQFGEGLKMALLTLLRNNRRVWIDTAGFSVFAEKKYSERYETNIMSLHYYTNNKTQGTDIYVECSLKELEEAKDLFMALTSGLEKLDTNVFLPSGKVYVMGLMTGEIKDALVSYGFEDKRLTNRDRNILEGNILKENVKNTWQKVKNKKVIREYLSNFINYPGAYEYQIPFLPEESKKAIWRQVLDKLYPKAVLSSDVKSDLLAKIMGYTVLRNIPYNVVTILRALGLKESNYYAKDYNGEYLIEKNKMTFPVTADYVNDWTRVQGIRELIANALDAGNQIRVSHNGKEARISDNGEGIVKKHFLFGVSQKGVNAIGKFGEGMKTGSLALARSESPVTIESVGWTYEVKVEYNKEFDSKLLVIYFNKNNRTKGTSIVFNCQEAELEEAKAMFAQFQGRRRSISTSDMVIYPESSGVIYVNGMESAKLPTFYSYDIKDKNIVDSRDRLHVDSYRVLDYLTRFYQQTDNEEAITAYLSRWLTNRNYLEFQANFFPDKHAVWKKVAKKLYGKACFAIDGQDNEDFIAKSAGYTLLHNVPYSVQRILEYYGVQRADKIARKHQGKGILLGNRIVYPITAGWLKSMTVNDAIKELISNSLDTGTKNSITCKDGIIAISDKGEGLLKKNLLFGGSEKAEEQIGQFGEGLKNASLVLARNNREFKLVTKGFEYTAKIEHDSQFNADVMVVYLSKSKKRLGTDITFKGSVQELEKAKNDFLEFNKEMKPLDFGIFEPGGKLFVNGVFIQNINSIFSYDLKNAKEIVSKDRKTVDYEKAKIHISVSLGIMENKKAIEKFLTNRQFDKLEHQLSINLSSKARPIWNQVADKVYHKYCFATGSDYDFGAKDKGYTLITHMSDTLRDLLLKLGVPTADKVAILRGDEKVIQKRFDQKKMTAKGKKRWEKALELFSLLYGSRLAKKIELVEKFKEEVSTDSTWGLYHHGTDIIYILAELVMDVENHEYKELTGTLIHEQVHRKTGAPDGSRAFEFGLSMELGGIAEKLQKLMTKSEII